MSSYDYIVVGAGSAGCVLANRLTADGARSVLLLEAGGQDKHPLLQAPLAFFPLMRDPKVSWGYRSEPEPHAGGRVIDLPRGRMLGGSSSINGMMYARGHRGDYDQWRQLGLPGWSYADVLPYFRRMETSWRGEGPYHGGSGPLTVSPCHTPNDRIYSAVMDTARARGLPVIDDFHGPEQEGFSTPEFTVHRGKRGSTAARYLRPALDRPNLTVETGALANRILLDDGRAVGVEYLKDGATVQARAAREVILSGGAYNSPQLLMLSGIGPADELREAGVEPALDLPGVGRNLQEHPALGATFAASGPFSFETQLRADRMALAVMQWALTGGGPVGRLPVSVMAFVRSDPALERPDLQILFSPVGMDADVWFPGVRPGKGHVLSISLCLVRPHSRGSMSLRSADPRDPPVIRLNLLEQKADVDALVRAIRFARAFFATPPASGLVGAELFPGPSAATDQELEAVVRATCATAQHPTSTCAMGQVVDAELKVKGVSGLRVADASVMPVIVGGNTNAAAIMIGEKASDLILGRTLAPAEI